MLAQSWRHLELLLVDDASGPEYDGVLVEAAALDERVSVCASAPTAAPTGPATAPSRMPRARSSTGLDSDDWAHPRWLERQAAPLLADAAPS